MLAFYQLICMAYGREGRNVEFKVRVMSQTLIDSQVHVIQVHKYCTIKCETFRFALAAENLKENERRA